MLKKNFTQAPEKKKKPQVYITSDEVVHAKRLLFLKQFGVGLFGFFLGIVLLVLVTGGGGMLRNWVESLIQKRFITQLETLRKTPTSSEQIPQTTPQQIETPKKVPSFFEKITEPFFKVLKKQDEISPETLLPENLVASSFTDLFSGVGWLDVSKTNMYHDRITTAFTLEPNFTWKQISHQSIPGDIFIKDQNNNRRRCINASCLEKRGVALFLNGMEISLPYEMRVKEIQNVSIGTIGNEWLVGIVVKEKNRYEGWMFFYDGKTYTRVFGDANAPFLSDYEGVIGGGGTKENWIAVYSAYEGQAYHMREGKPFQNISKFFGIRAMNGGFYPAVIRSGEGVDARWYVYSLNTDRATLLKLFQDGTDGDIRGIVDFTQHIIQNKFSRASFALVETRGGTSVLEADVTTTGGNNELWQFIDEGFKVPQIARVASINLNNYPAEVWSATVVDAEVFEGKSHVEFALSNDGTSWIPTRPGETVRFPDPTNRFLFWRAIFTPEDSARFSSPYFDRIRVDYKVKFL